MEWKAKNFGVFLALGKKVYWNFYREPVPGIQEAVINTQVSPPSKKAKKTRIGL